MLSPALLITSAVLALLVAGTAKAAVDELTHQAGNNIFEKLGPWFDARTSWKNKYKDYDKGDMRPAFPGATSWLVMFTDFWHLADSIYLSFYALGFLLIGVLSLSVPLPHIKAPYLFVVGRVFFGAVFEVFYSRIFRKAPR